MKPNQRFKPMSDALELRNLLDTGWQNRYTEKVESRRAEVGEALAQHLEFIYPARDMKLLALYGCAREIDKVTVRVYSPETKLWDQPFSIDLPRKVLVPDTHSNLCCGPRYSTFPNRGVNPETEAEIKAGKCSYIPSWEDYCADQANDEHRKHVPSELESYFEMLVQERKRYQSDYRECADFPKKYRTENGKYPTWGEIAAAFPVITEAAEVQQ